jgi:hypothetical protein
MCSVRRTIENEQCSSFILDERRGSFTSPMGAPMGRGEPGSRRADSSQSDRASTAHVAAQSAQGVLAARDLPKMC